MAENKSEKRFFKDIEYLRGAACILILIQHIMWICPLYFVYYLLPDCLLTGSGAFHIFFAISGFVVTYSLKDKLEKFSQENFADRFIAAKDFLASFYKRRFFRIMPVVSVLIVFSAVFFAMTDFTTVQGKTEWARDLFKVPFEIIFGTFNNTLSLYQSSGRIYGGGLGPLWTLAIESQFYILWPIALLICKNNKQRMTLSLLLGCLFLFIISPSIAVFVPHKYYMLHNNVSELFLGSFAAFLYDDNAKKNMSDFRAKVCFLILIAAVWIYPSCIDSKAYYSDIVVNCSAVLLVVLTAFYEKSAAIPGLSYLFGYLGSRSFSFYVIQLFLANAVVWFTNSVYFSAESFTKYEFYAIQFMIYLVVLLVSTEIIYKFVEVPARKLGRK